jgi:hypothetical protein
VVAKPVDIPVAPLAYSVEFLLDLSVDKAVAFTIAQFLEVCTSAKWISGFRQKLAKYLVVRHYIDKKSSGCQSTVY